MCLSVTTIRCATDGFKVWSPGVIIPKAFKRAELAGIKELAEKVHCKSSVARYCSHNRGQTGQGRHLHPKAISRVTSVCQINRSTCGIDTLLNQLLPV
jgi:hypothetical protein